MARMHRRREFTAILASIFAIVTAGNVCAQAQNTSGVSLAPRTFQAPRGAQDVFALGVDMKLWLDEGPFGNGAAKRQQVDANVVTFQASDSQNVLVLGQDGNLWLETAPFDRIPNPSRQQVDSKVWTFQALDLKNIFVLGADGNLWLERAPSNRVPKAGRQQIDGNVEAFQALDSQDVLVLGNDGNLWLEQAPFGASHRTHIDADVSSFQEPVNSTSIFVLGTNGNLWLEEPPFGKDTLHRQQVDSDVRSFEALAVLNWVWVLDNNSKLWLELGPFGKIPPARQLVDANVIAFQGLSLQQALILGSDLKLILAEAPFGKVPPNPQVVDVKVLPYARPGGPYLQSCSPGPPDLLGKTMTALCPNYFGTTVPSSLDAPYSCSGTIQNINGSLRCVVLKTVVTDSITETISFGQWSDAKGKHKSWTIDEPNVVQPTTDYKQIQFQPGDEVTVSAGGCVQTGGLGKTWKSYTNPRGQDADHLYSGTIFIPGAMPPGGGNGYARIGGFLKTVQIPEQPSPPVQSELFLHLGYQDQTNAYGDNGYYSHDNGNEDQCKGVGPAWVTVKILTPVAQAPTSSGGLPTPAPGAKAFDETWDLNNEDVNGLPLNPHWAYQLWELERGVVDPYYINPDFEQICGPAISGGATINTTILSNTCTTQAPTADISDSDLRGVLGYCEGSPLSGHLEWFVSTFTGSIGWDSFSGTGALYDDDFNFTLVPPSYCSLAAANGSTIGLELRADESIDNFTTPFWSQVRNYGKNGTGPNNLNDKNGDPKFALITGLLGIDGVHDGKSELHPVYSMAIQDSVSSKDRGTDETWQIFLVNSGVGGGCSNGSEHQWLGLSDDASSLPWYFISIPMPSGATSAKVVSYDIRDSVAHGGFVERQFGPWVYLGFQLGFVQGPFGPIPESLDGSVTIHYDISEDQATSRKMAAAAVRRPAEGTGEWQDAEKKMDSATRQKLDQVVRSAPPIHIPPRPHTVQLSLVNNSSADRALASLAARKHAPVRARVVANPELQTQLKKIEQAIAAVVRGTVKR